MQCKLSALAGIECVTISSSFLSLPILLSKPLTSAIPHKSMTTLSNNPEEESSDYQTDTAGGRSVKTSSWVRQPSFKPLPSLPSNTPTSSLSLQNPGVGDQPPLAGISIPSADPQALLPSSNLTSTQDAEAQDDSELLAHSLLSWAICGKFIQLHGSEYYSFNTG